ncbi:MAG: fasciclin domain-containing protein [Alphaproteobacteria bacterium]
MFIINFDLKAKGIVEIIRENPNFSIFYSYINNTELEATLQQKFPWNWTMFVPNNKAFEALPKKVYDQILSDTSLRKMLILDHILIGQKTSGNLSSKMTEEVTVTNKSIQLYKRESLYVKDMVVINENTSADNGVIHEINCVMFVQPSREDDRLTKLQKDKFPITSCCMQTDNEINLWLSAVNSRF